MMDTKTAAELETLRAYYRRILDTSKSRDRKERAARALRRLETARAVRRGKAAQ